MKREARNRTPTAFTFHVSRFTLHDEPLPRDFYGPSASVVAPDLLGHFLIRKTPEGPCGGVIVETEAYLNNDPACHGAPGPTLRNRVMFGPPGFSYVYFIYGCHYCVNAVCQPAGMAEAVLIRALEPAIGIEAMQRRRPTTAPAQLTNGPARLCQALGIDRSLDGADLCSAESPLFIAQNPLVGKIRTVDGPVAVTPRIGITKAAALELRFYLRRNRFVSRPHRGE